MLASKAIAVRVNPQLRFDVHFASSTTKDDNGWEKRIGRALDTGGARAREWARATGRARAKTVDTVEVAKPNRCECTHGCNNGPHWCWVRAAA